MFGAIVEGTGAQLVTFEASRIEPGAPGIKVGGLPETARRETSVRVRAALEAAGRMPRELRGIRAFLPWPGAPDVRGAAGTAGLDLAFALSAAVNAPALHGVIAVGELSLDGDVHDVRGVLAALEAASFDDQIDEAVIPAASAARVRPFLDRWPGLTVRAVRTLGEAIDAATVRPGTSDGPPPLTPADPPLQPSQPCMSDIAGLDTAKHALEIAAVGGFSLLLDGPPGAGKTMLARRMPGILPAMSPVERWRIAVAQDCAGIARDLAPSRRPFRAPHHTASLAAIRGGGRPVRPGEATLASGGVLFLDELPEFSRRAIESLQRIMHSRAVWFPSAPRMAADALVIGALDSAQLTRDRATPPRPQLQEAYAARCAAAARGFDLLVTLKRPARLRAGGDGESSATVRARVTAARRRFGAEQALQARAGREPGRLERVAVAAACIAGRSTLPAGDIEIAPSDWAVAETLTRRVD